VSKCLSCGTFLVLLNMFTYVHMCTFTSTYYIITCWFLCRHSVFVYRISTTTFTVLCVAGSVVLWSIQCSVFYSRRIFWFVLLNQPDVGCGSFKL